MQEEIIRNAVITILSSIDVGGLSTCLTTVTALYVPVAILIYQEFKEAPSFNKFTWDKTALLQEVVKGWQILGAVLLSSFAIICWACGDNRVKLILLLIFIVGIVILTKNLVLLFRWFMSDKVGHSNQENYRQKQKLKFLKNLDANRSLEVWSDLFGTIELENAFLKDYLKIFFEKFSEAEQGQYWRYELCLTQHMERLYYWGPDFQNEVTNFVFDAYIDDGATKNYILASKRVIMKRLVQLLAKRSDHPHFFISEAFDNKLAEIDPDAKILNAVKAFSSDVLNEIIVAYDDAPERHSYIDRRVFPISKWNVSALPFSNDEKAKAKATGLLIAYLKALPAFAGLQGSEVNDQRADFLDKITFGEFDQKVSIRMIRIVRLYFGQSFVPSYKNENIDHAQIRNFIDKDYRLLFMETPSSIIRSFNPEESKEQRLQRAAKEIKKMDERRDGNTIDLLSKAFPSLIDADEMEAISEAIDNYDLNGKSYSYCTDMAIVERNLEALDSVIDTIKNRNATSA